MNINWYPGHMLKAKKQIIEDLRLIDVVVELLDARIPIASGNPDIREVVKEKKKIIVLNKYDLANEKESRLWVEYYKKNNIPAILVDSNKGIGTNEVIKKIEEIMSAQIQSDKEKGRVGRKIRVLILGIPNVGKSSFINRIAKRVTATVGNKPGVTKKKQWIRLNDKVEMLDTPGVLWPKFEDEEIALHLAYTGTIKDDVIDKEEVGFFLLKWLIGNERQSLIQRYKLEEKQIEEIINIQRNENENVLEILHLIGKKVGAIVSGGKIDETKVANILLDDFRTGKLGKITIEKVGK